MKCKRTQLEILFICTIKKLSAYLGRIAPVLFAPILGFIKLLGRRERMMRPPCGESGGGLYTTNAAKKRIQISLVPK